MADVQNGQDGQGIKLFGAMITLHGGGQEKEDKKGGEDRTAEKASEKIIPCPRCKSMETKFCYFNNYNVNQPRHFCKGCQRYWTAGGALRNVPVGAGRRKAKPPCRGEGGFSEGFLYDASDARQFGLDQGLMLDEWHVAVAQNAFPQLLPLKRRRTNSGGQPL